MNLLLTIGMTLASLLPRADDAFWRDSIPEAVRASYVRYGEAYHGKTWETLPVTVFAEFKENGNRVNYEHLSFSKRRQLAALVMAEVMEGRGRFMSDIINGLESLCEETWWGIPAHYGKKIPVREDQTVDLFNAETASLVAWTRYMLQERLDQFSPLLCQRIDEEIGRRILIPALTTDYWWKKAGMNWNPWICSNWLTCILVCEKDPERRQEGIRQIREALGAFVDAYPDDGGCDEGTGYWDRAAASLFECIRLLGAGTGETDNLLTPKTREMMRYIYKMYIGNDYCVNFADAHENRMQAQLNVVYPIAEFLDDDAMRGLAASIIRKQRFLEDPAALYDKSGNFPTLGRELLMLTSRGLFALGLDTRAKEPRLDDVWLGNLQIMTARRGDLYVAMKGGHNGESHNHNDVGSFIVYADGEPLLIDPGVGQYTAKTFSDERYTIWTMQSAFHNLPQINGTGQRDGKQYAAKVIRQRKGLLSLDIAGAYPEEAAVRSWERTVGVSGKAVSVTERYELAAYRQPSVLTLMTTTEPVVVRPGVIALGDRQIIYQSAQLRPAVEEISGQLDPMLRRRWGERMYRIRLTILSKETHNTIKYQIK